MVSSWTNPKLEKEGVDFCADGDMRGPSVTRRMAPDWEGLAAISALVRVLERSSSLYEV